MARAPGEARASRRAGWLRPLPLPLLIAAAVGVAIGVGGGFDPDARLAFAALAGAALLAAVRDDGEAVVRLLATPAVVVLLALAALSAFSGAWGIEFTLQSLSWPLVIGGYAALAVAVGVFRARPGALAPLVAGLCVAATASAALGLVAMVRERAPLAILLDGAWRPAGPFEYPPALALLQVIAMPGLIWIAAASRGTRRVVAIATLVLALSAVVLSGSRLQLALALVVLAFGLAVVHRDRLVTSRGGVAAALAFLGCAAVAAFTLAPGQSNGSLGVDLAHGRTETWSAAVDTARERPWLGSGTETFERASAANQGGTAVHYAHNLPLDAWVELGVGGLGLVLCLYAAVGFAVWRARRRPEGWLFGVGAVVFLVSNLVDWPWHLAGLGAVWAVCLGGIVAVAGGRASDDGGETPTVSADTS